ncbi:MAG: hypothetical protein KH846_05840 [Leptotrichia wadei]|jgi:hypothetical protein|uniref:hypothetical protein n=1 Tax=Leptotrichia wadei TaxID=157687 RepID=UPI0026F1184B|nr:hypothetical protein [Leptotrichia wadei]MBS6019706.1 hypothetical protein [Leptotrichia wadei]
MKKQFKYVSLLIGIFGIIFGLGLKDKLSTNTIIGMLLLGSIGSYLFIILQKEEQKLENKEILNQLNELYKKEDNNDILENQTKEIKTLESLKNQVSNVNKEVSNLKIEICKNQEEFKKYKQIDIDLEKETLESIKQSVLNYEKSKNEITQLLKDYFEENSRSQKTIEENISKVGDIPEELTLLLSNLTNKLENKMKNEGELIEDLTEKIDSQMKKMLNSLTDLIDEISNSQDDVSEHIKKLTDSYNNFELITQNIVKQMTMMTNKDYEFLKGFLR